MNWQIDFSHSAIEFSVRHMMLAKTRGRFKIFTGTITADEQHPERSLVDVQIDTSSLDTRDEARDNHLRSPDFLDVTKYPYMTFKSTKLDLIDETHAKLAGDLTIRDVTRPVTLDVEYHGQARSPWGTTNAGFTAETKINRRDWGLTWNVALETGGVLVGDEITINIEIEAVQQAPVSVEQDAAVNA
jgi:polyisoprenoid-binding protein YceI